MKKISIAQPFFGAEEEQAVLDVLRSGWLVQGPKVTALEQQFSRIIGSKYAVACSSGTTALHLMLKALDIGPGDEVIVPGFSWVSTANVVVHCGADVVFCDVDPVSFNIDPDIVPHLITKRTKAIIVVHLFGLCATVDLIKAKAPGIPILEDAACAFGSRYRHTNAGVLGQMAAFSFHPRKSITSGEGGIIALESEELFQKLKVLCNHGINPWYNESHPSGKLLPPVTEAGFNYRMTDLQAALVLEQMKKWRDIFSRRTYAADYYQKNLGKIPWLSLPSFDQNIFEHSWQSYVIRLEKGAPLSQKEFLNYLLKQGIEARPGTYAIPDTVFYQKHKAHGQNCPNASLLENSTVALPIHPRLTESDYQYITDAINKLLQLRPSDDS